MPKWPIFAVQKGTNSSFRHDSTDSRQRVGRDELVSSSEVVHFRKET